MIGISSSMLPLSAITSDPPHQEATFVAKQSSSTEQRLAPELEATVSTNGAKQLLAQSQVRLSSASGWHTAQLASLAKEM